MSERTPVRSPAAQAPPFSGGGRLDRAAVEVVDRLALVRDVEAQPHQIEDALWRVESARLAPGDRPGGLIVCGMGGSAIGGDLAAAAVGARRRAPMRTVRRAALEPAISREALVLCASYSGETEETLACFADAGAAGAERVVLTTGGRLAAAARAEGVPVIGVPAGMQPRAAVAYMFVGALECAALCGAAPSLRGEAEEASERLRRLVGEWGPDAPEDALPKRLARRLAGHLPVIYGAAATAAVALRWKTQVNENAKLPAFSAELPEADHNELNAWEGAPGLAPLAAIFLDDGGADDALRRRVALTAREIGAFASALEEVPAFGSTPVERVAAGVLLGDFVSVYLAVLRGVDPTPVEAIERFKRALASAEDAERRLG
ncbi:MAG: Glucose-6-phosphate isomerase, archaeal II / Mannose-6-phosphate isomerase, archaeal [uncultured Solirubrobacterales bacterium]|uniref:Glucose-6-phosphate isomerase, archaeal II / Mannose-6-phosphate isomerase, archaeal n=1 Tax=uncultured Solirubrobacterales bacterium TaxID=768556 RepID=A0A6J4THE1_9ACTN|nr:MAG: Glucose-6-phosphate isomerase, archaeal II / Mannose-6-phosphate isomerase, archaeal [uncultured Solirubrobacterales bacterium]